MTLVWSEKVRNQGGLQGRHQVGLLRGTSGGSSWSTSGSLKISDRLRKSLYESGMVRGGF